MESKSKVDILNDLRKYNRDNRAMVGTRCVYTSKEGNHCGVGQYLKPEYQSTDFLYNKEDIDVLNDNSNLSHYLVEEVQGHSIEFWRDVQAFHDLDGNFTPTGLSIQGELILADLIVDYTEVEE